jgi:uncharacterized protein YegP (UPF0339 family)
VKNGGCRFKVGKSRRDGKYYAHLRATNGEIVAASEGYSRREDARQWCAGLAAWAVDALVRGLPR